MNEYQKSAFLFFSSTCISGSHECGVPRKCLLGFGDWDNKMSGKQNEFCWRWGLRGEGHSRCFASQLGCNLERRGMNM